MANRAARAAGSAGCGPSVEPASARELLAARGSESGRRGSRFSSYALQQTRQNPVRVEMLLGDAARGATVAFVIAPDRLHGAECVVARLEGEEPFAGRKVPPEPGLLRDHGAP